eukprot:scaffold15318_cov125-Isochrysis_galbana.AAC.1
MTSHKDVLFKRQRWPTRLACFARQEHPHCPHCCTGSNKHAMLGHFLTGTAAPCALSHRPAIAAAASRHHRCSGHLPGTREDSRGKGGGLSHCRPICHEVPPELELELDDEMVA